METKRLTSADWIETDRKYRIFSKFTAPIVLERAEGAYLWDVDGQRYLDFESGQHCVTVGHSHPRYVEAVRRQAGIFMQSGSFYMNTQEILLAKKLAEITPPSLKRTFFVSTGGESNEVAMRIARTYTGRAQMVGIARGYHGMTSGSLSITGFGGRLKEDMGIAQPVHFLPSPLPRDCQLCGPTGPCDARCLGWGLSLMQRTTSFKPAAVFVEPVMSAAGMIIPSRAYVEGLAAFCRETGALLVFDEAATAFGRTGTWFGFEHFGIVPDILCLSKNLGGSVPVAAVMTSDEIADVVVDKGLWHVTSHSGDPFLMAVALANLEIVEEEHLVENAARTGKYLLNALIMLRESYDCIGEVRGLGLMVGIDFINKEGWPHPAFTARVADYCRDGGLIVGHYGDLLSPPLETIRLLPPLTITEAQVDEAVEIIRSAIERAQAA